jgi:hypothetical protein
MLEKGEYSAKKLLLLILFSILYIHSTAFSQAILQNATQEVGLKNAPAKSSAIVWGDYDNDGDLDLYVGVGSWGGLGTWT